MGWGLSRFGIADFGFKILKRSDQNYPIQNPKSKIRNPSESLHLLRKIIFQGAFAINIGGGTV